MPQKYCAVGGCGALLPVGVSYCPRHQAEWDAIRQAEQTRKRSGQASRRWMKSPQWQRKQAAQLEREPLCAICATYGTVREATAADHVTPHRENRVMFWNGDLQSLCQSCHGAVKQRIERKAERAPDGVVDYARGHRR